MLDMENCSLLALWMERGQTLEWTNFGKPMVKIYLDSPDILPIAYGPPTANPQPTHGPHTARPWPTLSPLKNNFMKDNARTNTRHGKQLFAVFWEKKRVDKFWTNYGQNISSKLAIAHCPWPTHIGVDNFWTNLWVGCELAMVDGPTAHMSLVWLEFVQSKVCPHFVHCQGD